MIQLSHPWMTTEKNIALTIRPFISKMMSLLFNTLSRFVIAFLPRSKCLNFMDAGPVYSDSGAQEKKNLPLFPFSSPLFAVKWWDQMPWSQSFECWVLSQFFHFFHLHQEALIFICSQPQVLRAAVSSHSFPNPEKKKKRERERDKGNMWSRHSKL